MRKNGHLNVKLRGLTYNIILKVTLLDLHLDIFNVLVGVELSSDLAMLLQTRDHTVEKVQWVCIFKCIECFIDWILLR